MLLTNKTQCDKSHCGNFEMCVYLYQSVLFVCLLCVFQLKSMEMVRQERIFLKE